MTASDVGRIPEGTTATEVAPPLHVAVLLYALTGGVGWWVVHLVGLASLAPAVCGGAPSWVLSLVNGVCLLGVLSALAASRAASRAETPAGGITGRAHFLGHIAFLFNAASLALVILEGIPVYVLHPCR
jgi:hypothetical protein